MALYTCAVSQSGILCLIIILLLLSFYLSTSYCYSPLKASRFSMIVSPSAPPEFARFLGVDSSKMPAPQAAVDESQPAPALPAGNGQQQKQQSGISGVLLTSTALPQTSRSAVDSLMKATKRE